MTKINEILTLDLQEDIKNVIDLEDRSELEIQQEADKLGLDIARRSNETDEKLREIYAQVSKPMSGDDDGE